MLQQVITLWCPFLWDAYSEDNNLKQNYLQEDYIIWNWNYEIIDIDSKQLSIIAIKIYIWYNSVIH